MALGFLSVCRHLLVGATQFFADLLHVMVLIVDFRLLGEVLVLQVLELGHCLINDLHVSVLLLQIDEEFDTNTHK